MSELDALFADLEDPRQQHRRHSWHDIPVIARGAIIQLAAAAEP